MINVNNLSVSMDQRLLIDDLSFTVAAGQVLAILGPNGRGKTTLLRTMLGFHPKTKGDIQLLADVAYVPQQTQMLFSYDVLSVVLTGRARHLRWYQSPKKEDIAKAYNCLDALNLTTLAHQPFQQLSGGQKQLVYIARAMVSDSPIILLDEPTAALDLHNQNIMLKVLKQLAHEKQLTIVFTTHQPQHALHIADQTLFMYPDGCEVGPTLSMCTDEKLSHLYQLPIKTTQVDSLGKKIHGVIPLFE